MIISLKLIHRFGGRQPRGFAIVTAITLLAMVTLCMVVLTAAFEYEIASSRQTAHRLQMQLLASAGAFAVQQRLEVTSASAHWQLALPAAVQHRGGLVGLRIAAGKSGRVVATISAAYAGLHTRQTITYVRKSGHWQIQSIALRGNLHTPGGPAVGNVSGPASLMLGGKGTPPFSLVGVIDMQCRLKPISNIKNLVGVLVFKNRHSDQCFTVTVLRHIPPAGINAPFAWAVPNGILQGRYRVFLILERRGDIVGHTRGFTTKIWAGIFR